MFVLASGSKIRLKCLEQIHFNPDIVCPADIDETPLKKEKPIDYVKRVSMLKGEFVHKKYFGNIILSADTITTFQSRIIRKLYTDEEIKNFLNLVSGHSIKLITSIYLINKDNIRSQKTVVTSLKLKNLTTNDIKEYIKSNQGRGNCAGIAIEGIFESFVIKIIGSYSNILGLPLYQTKNMLISAGLKSKC